MKESQDNPNFRTADPDHWYTGYPLVRAGDGSII